jgi:hypothetical protein
VTANGTANSLTSPIGQTEDATEDMANKKKRGRPRVGETPLSRWLDGHGIERKKFAAELGVSTEYLHRLCRGSGQPSLELAARIEARTKGAIAATSWASKR